MQKLKTNLPDICLCLLLARASVKCSDHLCENISKVCNFRYIFTNYLKTHSFVLTLCLIGLFFTLRPAISYSQDLNKHGVSLLAYPNPFNDSTHLIVSLIATDTLNLRIYDTLGNEKAVIIDNDTFQFGTYDITWHADSLPRGTYKAVLIVNAKTTYRMDLHKEASTSVDEANKPFKPLSIFPNPAGRQIHFSENQTGSLSIYDVSGKEVYSTMLLNATELEIPELPGGIYVCRVWTNKGLSISQLIKTGW